MAGNDYTHDAPKNKIGLYKADGAAEDVGAKRASMEAKGAAEISSEMV